MTQVTNKTSLINFIVNRWRKPECRDELREKIVYATVNDKCYQITSKGSEVVSSLQCQHEEADGRIFLHAAHAARKGYQSVVICSDDTYVFIMALASNDKIGAALFQKCGTRTRTRMVDNGKDASTVGIIVSRFLFDMHEYTGCDTVSAFAGKGKATALKLLNNNMDIQDTFLRVGSAMGSFS